MATTHANLTPMLRQYFDFKAERPDVVLLMRVGDFFEAYGEDAETIARELEITLTGREDKAAGARIPMAGVPHHAMERYVARLIGKGFKVAVCDQVEDPKQAKGLVKRRVTRVMTPGTIVEDAMLDAKTNNYLVAAVTGAKMPSGVGVVDVSTGEFLATEMACEAGPEKVVEEIMRLQPAECLLLPGMEELGEAIKAASKTVVTFHQPAEVAQIVPAGSAGPFRHAVPARLRRGQHDIGLGRRRAAAGLCQADPSKRRRPYPVSLATYSTENYMVLDAAARRNLELTHSLADGAKSKSLVSILDRTVTPLGGRLLRKWFDQPLLALDKIHNRQAAVAEAVGDALLRGDLRDALRRIADLERLTARICSGAANARDLISLKQSLQALPDVAAALARAPEGGALAPMRAVIADPPARPDRSCWKPPFMPEPPMLLREGGLIRDGYNAELDALRELRSGGKAFIAQIEETERERTGIKGLKVGFNNVFGYYIEISKASGHVADSRPTYHRKQTTANAERYITPALKEYEAQVLGAEEKIVELEYQLFVRIRDEIADKYTGQILKLAKTLARSGCVRGAGRSRLAGPVCPPRSPFRRHAANHGGPSPGRGKPAKRDAVCPQRHLFRRRRDAPAHHHRPELGGQKHLSPSGRPDCPARPNRLICPRRRRFHRPGRPHLHPRRRA